MNCPCRWKSIPQFTIMFYAFFLSLLIPARNCLGYYLYNNKSSGMCSPILFFYRVVWCIPCLLCLSISLITILSITRKTLVKREIFLWPLQILNKLQYMWHKKYYFAEVEEHSLESYLLWLAYIYLILHKIYMYFSTNWQITIDFNQWFLLIQYSVLLTMSILYLQYFT